MPYDVEWKQGAIEDVTALFDYIAENSSLWDARNVGSSQKTESMVTPVFATPILTISWLA